MLIRKQWTYRTLLHFEMNFFPPPVSFVTAYHFFKEIDHQRRPTRKSIKLLSPDAFHTFKHRKDS